MPAKSARGGKWEPRFHPGVFVGMLNSSSEAAVRRRIEGLLRGDSSGSARLAATDERINRALADAVERDATRDPGVRSILKRASAVSHPESEPQKKVALDTEQEPTPRPSVSHGGSSASGTRHNTTMRTDQSSHTSDATRETRGEPAQGVTQASSGSDDAQNGVHGPCLAPQSPFHLHCRQKTECVAHSLQTSTDTDVQATVVSVGGVGAFDLISRWWRHWSASMGVPEYFRSSGYSTVSLHLLVGGRRRHRAG